MVSDIRQLPGVHRSYQTPKCTVSYAHALEQCVQRPNFTPKMVYTDTFPHLKTFLVLLFVVQWLDALHCENCLFVVYY